MNNNYIYEMGKLYYKYGDKKYFNLHIYPVLKEKWKNDQELSAELENMKNNLDNEAEYYRSYGRIEKILMIDNDNNLRRTRKIWTEEDLDLIFTTLLTRKSAEKLGKVMDRTPDSIELAWRFSVNTKKKK